MKRTRNTEAVCGNCPYYHTYDNSYGACRYSPVFYYPSSTEWCGRHPDFWLEEQIEGGTNNPT